MSPKILFVIWLLVSTELPGVCSRIPWLCCLWFRTKHSAECFRLAHPLDMILH